MCHSYQFEEGQESVGEQGSGVWQLMRHERSEDMRAPRRFSSPIHIASIAISARHAPARCQRALLRKNRQRCGAAPS